MLRPNQLQPTASRYEIRAVMARRSIGGARKTAAQKNPNTAAAPVHSQKLKRQNTESRNAPRIGTAQDDSSPVNSNRYSLQKAPCQRHKRHKRPSPKQPLSAVFPRAPTARQHSYCHKRRGGAGEKFMQPPNSQNT